MYEIEVRATLSLLVQHLHSAKERSIKIVITYPASSPPIDNTDSDNLLLRSVPYPTLTNYSP